MDPDQIYRRRWWTLAVMCLSLLVIGLDNTILNVALPTLVRDLGASSSQLQWIIDAYALVFASLLLTAGSLGDRYGRRRVLGIGLLGFGIGSVLSAFATTPESLIAWRALMGIGGAVIMPSTLSIVTNVFPAEERGRAIGIWAGFSGIGIAIGPVLGGWLLENFWWGSVFFINVPVIAVAVVAGLFLVPESRDPAATPLDPIGATLSTLGLATLTYALIEAPSHGWTDGTILGSFVAAGVLLVAFVLAELRVRHPIMDVRLFENGRFTAASISTALVFFALFGVLFFLTQYLQFVLGYGTLEVGVRLIPVAGSLMVAAPLSARLTKRLGTKAVVTAGLVLVAAGLGLLATASTASGYGLVVSSLVVVGLGMGTTMAPATDAIMGALPRARAGVGSAVATTLRQVGGVLGVAVLGSLLSSVYGARITETLQGLPSGVVSATSDSIGAAIGVAARVGGQAGQALTAAADAAFIHAMDVTVLAGAGVAVAGALVALLFLPATARQPMPEADEAEASEMRLPVG
ncbi:MAG TPA: MFS transporter [Actinomycetes bacterium]|nr:MFS transporter [Actinomycetes bacterium]